ncbi:uncharacterized protein [Rutidosis leptorrhynchoides]|uniref:uncharacterized protein n=1 Tax=Rutidosis leptorrhynchoides TaxID=125765 RepID=UPI003A9A0EF0
MQRLRIDEYGMVQRGGNCDWVRVPRSRMEAELTGLTAALQNCRIFLWRSRKKRIPTLIELDKRGIYFHSVHCPLCDNGVESVDHVLLFCKHAFEVWEKVFKWWGLNVFFSASLCEILQGASSVTMADSGFKNWQAVLWSSCYLIWWNRNQMVINKKCWTSPVALCEIQSKSFEWIAERYKSTHIDWHSWLHNPMSLVF